MKAVQLEGEAYEQLIQWSVDDINIFRKIHQLIKDIDRDPFKGLGKPEPLRYALQGYRSRRITQEHRLIYKMAKDEIVIVSMVGHYSN